MSTQTTGRIVKEIILKAPLSQVWQAISDAQEFGQWFRVDLSGEKFTPGQTVRGKMTYPGYEGMPFEMVVADTSRSGSSASAGTLTPSTPTPISRGSRRRWSNSHWKKWKAGRS